jgi:hypothetical protein
MGPARALQGAASAVAQFMDVDDDVSTATAEAAKELSKLRSKLEDNITIPVEEIPEGIEYKNTRIELDESGEEIEVEMPVVFTHEIANAMWEQQSQAIIDRYSGGINSKEAKNKFINEMTERYVAPGTLAISGKAATNRREHNWATSMDNINDILSSNAPSDVREEQALEILSRQLILGASPAMVTQQRQTIRPRIDYIDATNALKSAGSIDEIDQLETEIWEGGSSLSPDSRRQLSVEADKRRQDFEEEEAAAKVQNEEKLTEMLIRGDLTRGTVADYLSGDRISQEVARTLNNSLLSQANAGGTAKASNPQVLSHWRGEIAALPWTGGQVSVKRKAAQLKTAIRYSAMGLDMTGEPNNVGPTISGQDAYTLLNDVDSQVKKSLETPGYHDAVQQINLYTRAVDSITGQIIGNQAQRQAAILFKQALDNYMDTYGVDARPIDFFNANMDKYDPEIFERGTNQAFYESNPQVRRFMTVDSVGRVTDFNQAQQTEFKIWLRRSITNGTLDKDVASRIAAEYMAYYQSQGIAPGNGEVMLELSSPLYGIEE